MSDQIVTEEWRPIPDFVGVYEASSFGRIRRARGGQGTRAGYILKTYTRPPQKHSLTGYCGIGLYDRGKFKMSSVHRLVASAFFGTIPTGVQVNHKDGNGRNNHISNLELCSPEQNGRHARDYLNHGGQKLTRENVEIIRREYDGKLVTDRVLAKRFGVCIAAINHARHGRTWWSR